MADKKPEPLWIEPLYDGILPQKEILWHRRFYRQGLLSQDIAYVYGLFDRKSNLLVYVGQTKNLESRLKQHLSSTVKDIKEHVEIVPLQVCDEYKVSSAEHWWIQYAKYIGCPLRNNNIPGISAGANRRKAPKTNNTVFPNDEKLELMRRARAAVKALKIPDTKEGILAYTEFFEQLATSHPLFNGAAL